MTITADTRPALRRATPTGFLVAPYDVPEDEWHARRREGIGGSDVAALLGMSRYQTPFGLYLQKRGEAPEERRSGRLERAAHWGHLHEPLLAGEFSRMFGLRTRRVGLIRHINEPWMQANLDRQVAGCPDGPCLLEIKNRSAYKAEEWGETGDPDGVPDAEALQTIWYLAVTGYGHGHVAVLLNGNDDRYYRVDRDPQIIADLVDMAARFWQRVRTGDAPPIGGLPAESELLGARWLGGGDPVVVDSVAAAELIARRAALAGQITALKTEREAAGNQLKAMLGDHDTAIGEDGKRLFTWGRNGTFGEKNLLAGDPVLHAEYVRPLPRFDLAAFQADHPDTYQAHRARVLRISGGSK